MGGVTDQFGWAGHELGGATVERAVARGGFSIVYRARHAVFGEDVAIKCLELLPDLDASDRKRFVRLFLAEGRTMYRLTRLTPSIVQPLNMGAERSPSGIWTPWLMLEWLEGRTLGDELLRRAGSGRRGMSIEAAVRILSPIAEALKMAHESGLVHCDVKPDNIFLWTRSGKPASKLLDFGIARVLRGPGARYLTTTGAPRLLSRQSAAPEQLSPNFGEVGPATDVYALALVVVWCVRGVAPYEGDELDMVDQAIDPVRRPTLRAFQIPCNDAVENVLQRALAVDSRVRFQAVDTFWQALQEAMGA